MRKLFAFCQFVAALNMDPETAYDTHTTLNHPTMYWVGGTGWNIRPLYDRALLSGDDTLMREKVVLSQPGFIHLMPGWPADYADGSITGVLVRGGHTIDISWADGKLESAILHAGRDGLCEIRYGDKSKTLELKAGEACHLDGSLQVGKRQID